jgi:hypothetical protein
MGVFSKKIFILLPLSHTLTLALKIYTGLVVGIVVALMYIYLRSACHNMFLVRLIYWKVSKESQEKFS